MLSYFLSSQQLLSLLSTYSFPPGSSEQTSLSPEFSGLRRREPGEGWQGCWGRSLPGYTRTLFLNQERGALTAPRTHLSRLPRVPCRVLGSEVLPVVSECADMVTSIIPRPSWASASPPRPSLNRHQLASQSATFPVSS